MMVDFVDERNDSQHSSFPWENPSVILIASLHRLTFARFHSLLHSIELSCCLNKDSLDKALDGPCLEWAIKRSS